MAVIVLMQDVPGLGGRVCSIARAKHFKKMVRCMQPSAFGRVAQFAYGTFCACVPGLAGVLQ